MYEDEYEFPGTKVAPHVRFCHFSHEISKWEWRHGFMEDVAREREDCGVIWETAAGRGPIYCVAWEAERTLGEENGVSILQALLSEEACGRTAFLGNLAFWTGKECLYFQNALDRTSAKAADYIYSGFYSMLTVFARKGISKIILCPTCGNEDLSDEEMQIGGMSVLELFVTAAEDVAVDQSCEFKVQLFARYYDEDFSQLIVTPIRGRSNRPQVVVPELTPSPSLPTQKYDGNTFRKPTVVIPASCVFYPYELESKKQGKSRCGGLPKVEMRTCF